MNIREVFASSLAITPSEMKRLTSAMMIDAPSSTPRIGRNESARYSKNESSQATLPRPLARAAALTSAFDIAPEPDALDAAAPPMLAICGRCMISSYMEATAPPMTTW